MLRRVVRAINLRESDIAGSVDRWLSKYDLFSSNAFICGALRHANTTKRPETDGLQMRRGPGRASRDRTKNRKPTRCVKSGRLSVKCGFVAFHADAYVSAFLAGDCRARPVWTLIALAIGVLDTQRAGSLVDACAVNRQGRSRISALRALRDMRALGARVVQSSY
jgi:hypothetical protein